MSYLKEAAFGVPNGKSLLQNQPLYVACQAWKPPDNKGNPLLSMSTRHIRNMRNAKNVFAAGQKMSAWLPQFPHKNSPNYEAAKKVSDDMEQRVATPDAFEMSEEEDVMDGKKFCNGTPNDAERS